MPSTWPASLRLAAAAACGVLVGVAFEPIGAWPLLFVGLAGLSLVIGRADDPHLRTARSRALAGAGLGYAFGLGLLAVSVSWLGVLGWWVGALLVLVEAGWYALLGWLLHRASVLPFRPLWSAAALVSVEFCFSRVPFGGFGWTRLAYAGVDSAFAGLLPIVGVAGTSFAMALTGFVLASLITASLAQATRRAVLTGAALVAVMGVALLAGRYPLGATSGQISVGMVQGDIEAPGLEGMGRARTVTNNHLSETITLLARARTGLSAVPDFILWPENSTDIDPLKDDLSRATVQTAVDLAGVPIFVGAVLSGPGEDERQTAGLWWDPVRGVTARVIKRNIVPFGEYIPFRDLLLPLVPVLELVGEQSVAGTEPGLVTAQVGGRSVTLGNVICFELAYDDTVHDVVRGGGQLITVQSNNATYAGTAQVYQQFAITRARAIEARRDIVVATTNSLSGHVDARGRVVFRSEEGRSESRVFDVPLRSALTPAVRWGATADAALASAGLAGALGGLIRARRFRLDG